MPPTTSFELSTYLHYTKSLVESALDEILPQANQRPAILHAAMRYSAMSGGKRIRPILCIAAWQACSDSRDFYADIPPQLRQAATAIELLHTYTLIHDDLPCMDNDDLRRGKPTTHKVYGEANALLAGDALLTLAFETTARADLVMASGCGFATLELAQASGSQGLVGGQVEDLETVGQAVSRETIDFVHENKTAKLFRAATRIGARMADANNEQWLALSQYGQDLGIAFQITDDLLDNEQDQRNHKSTAEDPSLSCLSVMTRKDAKHLAHKLTQSATEALNAFSSSSRQPLLAIVKHLQSRTV